MFYIGKVCRDTDHEDTQGNQGKYNTVASLSDVIPIGLIILVPHCTSLGCFWGILEVIF